VLSSHETLVKLGFFDQSMPSSLERRCRWRYARAKEWLYELDDRGTVVYFLTWGTVRVLITPSSDRAVILADIDAANSLLSMVSHVQLEFWRSRTQH
jgi:hypothetical protein